MMTRWKTENKIATNAVDIRKCCRNNRQTIRGGQGDGEKLFQKTTVLARDRRPLRRASPWKYIITFQMRHFRECCRVFLKDAVDNGPDLRVFKIARRERVCVRKHRTDGTRPTLSARTNVDIRLYLFSLRRSSDKSIIICIKICMRDKQTECTGGK